MATAAPTALPRTRRERQRLETRELLFALAIDEFRRVGRARARIRDIVEAAGVVPGTFYHHFPTKDHVVLELWRRNARRLSARLPAACETPPPVGDALRALCDAMLELEREVGDIELVRDSIAVSLRPPDGARSDVDDVASGVIRLLEAGLARGEIVSELDPPALARVLLTSILGVALAAPDAPALRAHELRRTVGFFLRALEPA